jgi:hypothetical protein
MRKITGWSCDPQCGPVMAAIEELFFNDAGRSDENLACFQKTRPATARFVLPDPKEFPVTQRGGLSACPARVAAAAGRPEPPGGGLLQSAMRTFHEEREAQLIPFGPVRSNKNRVSAGFG